ncbi:MAG: hypothetical protein HY290_32270 [Planctomycetia bacterium]|nr:hypothetical protein [Planctomycetia bacterium]
MITLMESSVKRTEQTPTASDYVNLQLRLVQDRPDGPPAEGFTVEFPKFLVAPGVPLKLVSGPTGIADLGPVRADRHSLTVTSPWNTKCEIEFDVRAGLTTQTESLVCPAAPPSGGKFTIDVDWPDDLKAADVGLICSVFAADLELHGGTWTDESPEARVNVLVRSDGEIMKCERMGVSDASDDFVDARLSPLEEAPYGRGPTQVCSVKGAVILQLLKETQGVHQLKYAESWGIGFDVLPKSLLLRTTGTGRFKIVLSEETLDIIRNKLDEHASVARILDE